MRTLALLDTLSAASRATAPRRAVSAAVVGESKTHEMRLLEHIKASSPVKRMRSVLSAGAGDKGDKSNKAGMDAHRKQRSKGLSLVPKTSKILSQASASAIDKHDEHDKHDKQTRGRNDTQEGEKLGEEEGGYNSYSEEEDEVGVSAAGRDRSSRESRERKEKREEEEEERFSASVRADPRFKGIFGDLAQLWKEEGAYAYVSDNYSETLPQVLCTVTAKVAHELTLLQQARAEAEEVKSYWNEQSQGTIHEKAVIEDELGVRS